MPFRTCGNTSRRLHCFLRGAQPTKLGLRRLFFVRLSETVYSRARPASDAGPNYDPGAARIRPMLADSAKFGRRLPKLGQHRPMLVELSTRSPTCGLHLAKDTDQARFKLGHMLATCWPMSAKLDHHCSSIGPNRRNSGRNLCAAENSQQPLNIDPLNKVHTKC